MGWIKFLSWLLATPCWTLSSFYLGSNNYKVEFGGLPPSSPLVLIVLVCHSLFKRQDRRIKGFEASSVQKP
jgi:hypothetical protein